MLIKVTFPSSCEKWLWVNRLANKSAGDQLNWGQCGTSVTSIGVNAEAETTSSLWFGDMKKWVDTTLVVHRLVWSGCPGVTLWSGCPGVTVWSGCPGVAVWSGCPGVTVWSGCPGVTVWFGCPGVTVWFGCPGVTQCGLGVQGLQWGLGVQGLHCGLGVQGVQCGLSVSELKHSSPDATWPSDAFTGSVRNYSVCNVQRQEFVLHCSISRSYILIWYPWLYRVQWQETEPNQISQQIEEHVPWHSLMASNTVCHFIPIKC